MSSTDELSLEKVKEKLQFKVIIVMTYNYTLMWFR